jgi:tetratricopeptide (TPR) repeat protein
VKDKDEIFKAAHQYVSMGRIDDAIDEYRKILPYSVDGNIHNIIGDLYLKKESKDEAIKYFREAAVIFNKDESHAKAIALYNKILSINPDQHAVEMELAELNAERGFITQAIEGMSRAAEACYSKGLPMKALGIYKKALKLCPSNIQLKFIIADLHLEANHTDSAVKLYLAIAMEYEANAESARAEHMYKKVFSLDPDNIESLTHLSRLAEDDQDLELALEYMSKAVAIAPHNSEIMSEYSNLKQKANKEISEDSQQVQDGPDHQEPQHIQIPGATQNSSKTDSTHEPLDLSSDSSNSDNLHSSKPISTSSPLPITSTGSGNEETGFPVPPDTGDTGTVKNGIWDNSLDEKNSNPSVIDSIQGKTSQVIPEHETAEAAYDQNTGEYEFNPSVKEPVQKKSEKDIRRLKKRVKTNRVHVLLIVIFTFITVVSFFIAFKFIKNSQTVDVETPEHIISPQPFDQNIGDDIDIPASKDTTTELNTAEEQPIKKSVVINTTEYPEVMNQEELTHLDIETENLDIDDELIPDNTIEIAPADKDTTLSDNMDDSIKPELTPDTETIHETEEPQVINQEDLILPDNETNTLSIDSEIIPDNIIEIAPAHKDNTLSGNMDDSIKPELTPDTETIHETDEPQVINQEDLILPDKESETLSVDSEIIPDNTIEITPAHRDNTISGKIDNNSNPLQNPDELHVINQGKLTIPEKESDSLALDSEIMPDDSIETAPEEEGNNYSNNTEDNIISTMKSDSEIAQEQENINNDSETLTVSDVTDEMQQEDDHKEKGTAIISFNEHFDNNDNRWDIVNTSAAHVRLNDGKYFIQNRRNSGEYIILNGPVISTDLDFEVESHLNSADPLKDHSYGLIFGAKNKEDFFVFQLLPENKYSIKKYFRGVSIELAGGNINSKPESQDFFNVLKIISKDNKLSFFINGYLIDEVPDIFFSNRKTGFFVDRNAEIVIDKILIHHQSG